MNQVLTEQLIYRFGSGEAQGNRAMNDLLGGKGANLAEMASLGVPVPPGFTITTDVCRHYFRHGELPAGLEQQIQEALDWLGTATGRTFGATDDPLLVSVRSGAPLSMPGMMDTVLNVGLNDESVSGLAKTSGSPTFALDSYRRLMHMFGNVVLDLPEKEFAALHDPTRHTEDDLQALVADYHGLYRQHTGNVFPQDPLIQLHLAIRAVFESWKSERATFYRSMNKIPDDLGTAVTVQAMVFGNRGEQSGTGVGFTRNPSNGERTLFAEFLHNAQGEDIVAGVRTPLSIAELASSMPAVFEQLVTITDELELHYRDVQDFEFTIEQGRLYLLQTRSAKRTAQAAVRIAVDMANENLISRKEAVGRVNATSLSELLTPQLDLGGSAPAPIAHGLPASAGAAVGRIALTSDMAVQMSRQGVPVILITEETTADDIQGMSASEGFLTARGGATSHAAVVARGMGKCCVTGVHEIEIDSHARKVRIGASSFAEGDWISLDGAKGLVYAGALPRREKPAHNAELATLLQWACDHRECEVRANADTPADADAARLAGATGVGLCRTEHMFFDAGRLQPMRAMILASTEPERQQALRSLLPLQQADFEKLFRVMAPLPVTVRLLDPPLHEFLPSPEEIAAELSEARGAEEWDRCIELDSLGKRARSLVEANPMMGHRGCRLSLTYPEILAMQVRAILQAAATVRGEGLDCCPEIMVPLVATEQEMVRLAAMVKTTAEQVALELGSAAPYKLGTMIELPRAAVCAGPISRHVQFISFGTNDLTQMTYGFSRDDSSRFLETYIEQGILSGDPFLSIDEEGVGSLMQSAIRSARLENPQVKIGVCGEHGGDPSSIRFFRKLGVDYVSCSPARIPVAQLASAHV